MHIRQWALRNWSISLRLALSYAVSAFVLVAAATWLQYRSLARDLAEEDDQLLVSTSSAVVRDLALHERDGEPVATPRGPSNGEVLLRWRADAFSDAPRVRLLSPRCEPLEGVPAGPGLPPAVCALPVRGGQTLSSWTSPAGVEWRIASRPLADGRRVEILLNRETDTTVLRRSRRQLAVVLVLVLCVAGILGHAIARQGLAPIKRLTARMTTIDARSLNQRLVMSDAPPEVRVLAQSFDTMLERLAGAFDALTGYSAELAHELRTPLHVLRQHLEVALTRSRTSDEYREVLTASLENVERLRRMADDILFLARAQDPRAPVHLERLDAREELEAVADFLDALTEERGVSCVIEAADDIGFEADRMLLRRALVNLISNALQHTPPTGAIVLRGVHTATGTALSIGDSGVGMSPEELERVFERYYRAPSGGARATGAGLGLSIVRGIAELHGGTARIRSEPGRGTTVTIELPHRRAVNPLAPQARESSATNLSEMS